MPGYSVEMDCTHRQCSKLCAGVLKITYIPSFNTNTRTTQSTKAQQVFQYHITGWSVDGHSSNLKSITDVIEDLTKVQMRTSNKPTVVHCSDTVTRSGMFCAIATTIERCKTEGVVDVFQVVKALRVQKPGAVPTVVS